MTTVLHVCRLQYYRNLEYRTRGILTTILEYSLLISAAVCTTSQQTAALSQAYSWTVAGQLDSGWTEI